MEKKMIKTNEKKQNRKPKTSKVVKETSIKKETEKTPIFDSSEIMNLIKIILIVSAVFLIFYCLTFFITKYKKTSTGDVPEAFIQYDEILLGTLFEQSASEYYVLITKEKDEYIQAYNTYLSTYKNKENAIRVYTTNLDLGFNKQYISEESYIKTNNLSELKFKTSTLLKIKNKKIVNSYEGNAKIIEHLKALIK